uniref:Retroviral polymerase SH3-like domain-containing protein n=1 Tax=Tanacetum cinerariifolium TaxID=118510 RepID=A0A699JAD5_TANCI|nr:hypothetical protein [Tanacetum cinerariifolium]
MALGYLNPSYLKKAQLKQQSLYNGNLLLEEHDPSVVYDSEETLELAQESREKIRFLKKEIKPANYAKINHLSRVFVSQTTKSREELFLSNVSNMVTVFKTISIPNEDLSDDTTSSVARKFLNEVKSSLVTLQRVVKQKMTLEVHNWSSSAHKEVYRIISHEIAPIINQVDARVQSFEIQFLQEVAKFVQDFKSLAKEADESLDKQKSLELEIERLLKASVSHDIMSIVQNSFVNAPSDLRTELDRTKEKLELCIIKKEKEYAVLWNNWYTKCEECKYDKISYDKAYKDMQQKVERLQARLRDLKGKSSDTPRASNTLDPLNEKLESKIVELKFQVVNYEREISHLKTTYKNLFDSIKSNRAHAKLHDLIYENTQLRAQGFDNTSESMKSTSGTSVTPYVDKPKLSDVTPLSKKLHASMPSHSVPQPREFNVVKHRNVIAPGMFKINPSQTPRENVSSDTVTASFTGLVHTARTRRPQPKGKTRNAMVPYASKSSEVKKTITVEEHCLGHNLFSIGQFCDADLDVAFRRNTCFIIDLDGVDMLKGNHSINLYTINLYNMASASSICLMARATPTKTKDETPEVIKNFLKKIYVRLQAHVIIVRTDNETEFKNHGLKEYFDSNNREDIGKLGAKGDIGFFIGYSANSVAYIVYNRRTKKIMETMNVTFDELSAMAFEQNSSRPSLQNASRIIHAAPVVQNLQAPTTSMSFQYSAPVLTNSSNTPVSSQNVDTTSQQHSQQQRNHTPSPTTSVADNVLNAVFEGDLFVNPFGTPSTESVVSSTQYVDPLNMHTFYQSYPHDYQ